MVVKADSALQITVCRNWVFPVKGRLPALGNSLIRHSRDVPGPRGNYSKLLQKNHHRRSLFSSCEASYCSQTTQDSDSDSDPHFTLCTRYVTRTICEPFCKYLLPRTSRLLLTPTYSHTGTNITVSCLHIPLT